jgi:hypothetical protein
MGYYSLEHAGTMSRAALAVALVETQTMAAAAIAEALTVGGHKSELRIMERYEKNLPRELRQEVHT